MVADVLIPLNSGLHLIPDPGAVDHQINGLNPFEFRASFDPIPDVSDAASTAS